MLAVVWFAPWKVPLAIWLVFYVYLLHVAQAPVTGKVFRLVFENRIAAYLGRVSYSIYLSHLLLMTAIGIVSLRLAPDTSQEGMLAIMLGAVVFTLPLSSLLFVLVEKPGNRLGARLASALQNTPFVKIGAAGI